MSDISKKIFSIEPDIKDVIKNIEPLDWDETTPDKAAPEAKPALDKKAAPKDEPIRRRIDDDQGADMISSKKTKPEADEKLPAFISEPRPSAALSAAPIDPPSTAWIAWLGALLTLIWLVMAGFYYYSQFGLSAPKTLPAIMAIIMVILLPAILITLLWTALRRLAQMKHGSQALVNTIEKTLVTEAEKMTATDLTQDMAQQLQADIAQIGVQMDTLTQQRKDLEEQVKAYETRAADLSAAIAERSESLASAADTASENITAATQSAAELISGAGDKLQSNITSLSGSSKAMGSELQEAATTLSASENQLTRMNTQLSEMISRLQEEQTKLQTEMNTQVKEMSAATELAMQSSEQLMESLRRGEKSVTALNSASINTNNALSRQFEDMGNKIATTQMKVSEVSDKAATRVQESLAQTRRDLSKLETDILALQAKLRNTKKQGAELDLGLAPAAQPQGIGRLQLQPLDTDFPPVEPPRLTPAPRASTQELFGDNLAPLDTLQNDGADINLHNPDDDLTQFSLDTPARDDVFNLRDADILRRPAADQAQDKKRNKSGWKWRDMLGGIDGETTSESAADIVGSIQPNTQALDDSSEIVATLCEYDLAPSAIVDEGTIIEAANAYANAGGLAMQGVLRNRLAAPAAHLRQHLAANPAMSQKYRRFTDGYLTKIGRSPQDASHLRAEFGTAQGRAFLICIAAFG